MIRRATTDDVEELYLLETICFRERRFQRDHILWILHHPNAATFVETDKKTRGALMLLVEGTVCRVLSIAVHPAFRLKGIGSMMMDEAERFAREHSASEVRLEVSTMNHGAMKFYLRLGYKNVGTMAHYYSWGEDAYSMSKSLEPRAKS